MKTTKTKREVKNETEADAEATVADAKTATKEEVMKKSTNEKLNTFISELNAKFIERDDVITATMTAFLARHHVCLIGPPGTAKSLITRALCEAVGGTYFERLLTKFSTPEELFGPVSLKGLKEDKYRRVIDNKLPEANVAFLDEIFKANSAILNSLLTLINERKYHNDGDIVDVPLYSVIGASNELPEGEELGALWDRFTVRLWVDYIADDGEFGKLLAASGSPADVTVKFTEAEVEEMFKAVDEVTLPQTVIDSLVEIRRNLADEGIRPSDRRFVQTLKLVKASAVLDGRTTANEDDLDILRHSLWNNPDERTTVAKVVGKSSNPMNAVALELLDAATEVFEKARKEKTSEAGIEANATLKALTEKATKAVADAKAGGHSSKKIEETAAKIKSMNSEIVKTCLGIG